MEQDRQGQGESLGATLTSISERLSSSAPLSEAFFCADCRNPKRDVAEAEEAVRIVGRTFDVLENETFSKLTDW